MSDTRDSRIGLARRRTSGAKRAFAVAAAVGFVAAALLARAAHPGQSTTQPGNSGASGSTGSTFENDDDDGGEDFGLGFGQGSIAPSGGGAPAVHSSVS